MDTSPYLMLFVSSSKLIKINDTVKYFFCVMPNKPSFFNNESINSNLVLKHDTVGDQTFKCVFD